MRKVFVKKGTRYISLPATYCAKQGIEAGDYVDTQETGDSLILQKVIRKNVQRN